MVFDFDGLIVDTETAVFDAAVLMLAEIGHVLEVEQWAALVERGEDDSWEALCATVGCEIDRARYDAVIWAQDATWHASVPLLAGVEALLNELHRAGVPCAVASSSPARWIDRHLDRHELRHRFDVVTSSDRVDGRTKPAPDVYLLACDELGVEPAASVALEDSSPGIAAAIAAGLSVVAVPNKITRCTDLSAAHRSFPSLEHVTIEDLVALVEWD